MTNEQFHEIERSYKHSGDALIFKVGERVFMTERDVLKHRKEATVEMRECSEFIDVGDISSVEYRIILSDPYTDNDNAVATVYYDDEIVEISNE